MTYRMAVIKKNCELVIMSPFVLAGKLAGRIFPLKSKHTVFFFFSSADIGGAIQVNADITKCIKDKNPLIIFSKKPKNNGFLHLFDIEGVRSIDLHRLIDNKWCHFINFFFRGVISSWINKVEKPVVFGGESLFFYKVIPHVKKSAHRIELCHLNTWFNFSQAFVRYMDRRVFSTPKIKRDAEKQYAENKVPASYLQKLSFVDNKIDIPTYKEVKNPVLEVLYVGRGAPQKRVYLIADIAKRMFTKRSLVHFSFAGDVTNAVPADANQFCTLYGNIADKQKMNAIYQNADLLILTSAYEGLPLVIMEMMALGRVVISTAVDGIPDYITHKENGLLINETDEEKIVTSAIGLIELLISRPELKNEIGQKARAYAIKHFNGETFCNVYCSLLTNNK